MDYSKLKKILVILCIFSVLLSLKTKVFGVTYTVDYQSITDVYDTRASYWVVALNASSHQLRQTFIDYYTDPHFFPFFTVAESGQGYGGRSDIPNTSLSPFRYYLYFLDLDNYTVSPTTDNKYMGFDGANVFSFTSPVYYNSIETGKEIEFNNFNYSNSVTLYMPMILFNYRSPIMENYISGLLNNDSETIAQAIEDATDRILDTTVDSSTQSEISSNLQQNNNTNADSLTTNFFSTLVSSFESFTDYSLTSQEVINIPLPNSNKTITLRSRYLYDVLPDSFKTVIYGFWYFLFGFYMFKFINRIVIAVKSGNILNGLSSNDEVITNDML